MKRDSSKTVSSNEGEALSEQQRLLSTQSPSASLGKISAPNRPLTEVMKELLLQVFDGNQKAWAMVKQSLDETVRSWLHGHPSQEAACYWESEDHYVSLTFKRFQEAITVGQLQADTSLPTILRHLQVCLNGVLLDSLRARGRPKGIGLHKLTHTEEKLGAYQPGNHQLWERIQRLFPDTREQRVAYLLFHCNLSPRDIFSFAPQEFSDMQEICRLRARILERILLHFENE